MESVAPLPAVHFSAGLCSSTMITCNRAFVHLDDVVDVALVEVVGLERVVEQVRPFHVAGGVEAFDAGELFGVANAFIGQVAGVLFLLDFEVDVPLELADDLIGLGYLLMSSWAGPEMISGVRASSMRMLSISSMMAKSSGP